MVGIQGIGTRALTSHVRDHGSQQGVISHADLDPKRVVRKAREAPSILGRDLVKEVTCAKPYKWTEDSGRWALKNGGAPPPPPPPPRGGGIGGGGVWVVAFCFWVKDKILWWVGGGRFEVTRLSA